MVVPMRQAGGTVVCSVGLENTRMPRLFPEED